MSPLYLLAKAVLREDNMPLLPLMWHLQVIVLTDLPGQQPIVHAHQHTVLRDLSLMIMPAISCLWLWLRPRLSEQRSSTQTQPRLRLYHVQSLLSLRRLQKHCVHDSLSKAFG